MGKKNRNKQKAAKMGAGGGDGDGDGGVENRKHPRVALEILVQVRSESIAEFKSVHAKNISVGGMFISASQARPVGAQIYFQFTVKDGGTLIEGLGKVVHSSAAGMGVEFVSVLEPSATNIRTLVEHRLSSSSSPAAPAS